MRPSAPPDPRCACGHARGSHDWGLHACKGRKTCPCLRFTAPADVTVRLSLTDLALLIEALDSHEYWQLTDQDQRNNGASLVADGEQPAIDACRALSRRLDAARGTPPG